MLKIFSLGLPLNQFSESTTNLYKTKFGSARSLNVGILELEILENKSMTDRISCVLQIIRDIVPGEFDLIVLPELWTEGAFDFTACQTTDFQQQNSSLSQIANLAKSKNVYIHAGTFPIRSNSGKLYNTALVFSPDENQEIKYEKIHLFGFEAGEKTFFEPGQRVVSLDISGIQIGISTCYDLRFSELYLQQIRAGAKVLVVSASWPKIRIRQWESLLIARAIEGQAYVIACNATGISGTVELGGYSMAIDPFGNVMDLKKQTGLLVCTLDISILDEYRKAFPMLQDRHL